MEMTLGPSIVQEQVFEHLVTEYQGMLLKLCYVYLKDAEQAKDAVQETYFKAYRALPSFRHECSEKSWLIRIAINTCKSMQRSAWFRYTDKRITPEQLPMAAPMQTNEPELMCEIMELPPKLREVILLHYWQRMGVQEIGDLLGIAPSSVSNRLRRAREKLRYELERGYYHE